MKKSVAAYSSAEFREASPPGMSLGEENWQLQNNSKKGIKL
jgi:hypothetical protein